MGTSRAVVGGWVVVGGETIGRLVDGMIERDIDTEIEGRLRERDVRYTRGREAVVRALLRAGGPQSAGDLHRRLRSTVPLSSLYRSLAVLDEAGVLVRHHDASGLARFELAEWLSGHHHHVLCVSCGRVVDVAPGPGEEETLAEVAMAVAKRTGFDVRGHVLDIEGVCGACRNR